MKKYIAIASILLSNLAFAQVAIGKKELSNGAVSLEFGDYTAGQGKGLILPYVQDASSMNSSVPGTLVFDTSDNIVKYKTIGNSWVALTTNEITTVESNPNFNTAGQVDTSLQNSYNEIATAKASIGTPSDIEGVLVLEESQHAMVLPKVPNPHLNIINPEPGTIVYDTVNNQLAVFNGTVWSFWKP